jgi:hypothetical protein
MKTFIGRARRPRQTLRVVAALGALLILSAATGQVSWPVTAIIPESLLIRTPGRALTFDLSANYPPAEFPAAYPLEGGRIPIQVQSNLAGEWLLELTIEGPRSEDGQVLLPADQIEYRVSGLGSEWTAATGVPEVIYVGSGSTDGWLDLWIELRIVLRGPERSGPYQTYLVLDAVTTGL